MDTTGIATPAKDALTAEEAALTAAIAAECDAHIETLMDGTKAQAIHLWKGLYDGSPHGLSKAALVYAVAVAWANESETAKRLAELRKAAAQEQWIIDAIAESGSHLDMIAEAVVGAAADHNGERAVEQSVRLAKAAATMTLWGYVRNAAINNNLSPVDALVEVVQHHMRGLAITSRRRLSRSTSAITNLVEDARAEATAEWIDQTARLCDAVGALLRG